MKGKTSFPRAPHSKPKSLEISDGEYDDDENEKPAPGFHLKRGGAVAGGLAKMRLDKRARGGKLTAHQRQSLPKSDFALPGHGTGPKGAGSGSYPIPDEPHARNALARVSQHGSSAEKAEVRAKVHAKYPDIHEGKARGGKVKLAADRSPFDKG